MSDSIILDVREAMTRLASCQTDPRAILSVSEEPRVRYLAVRRDPSVESILSEIEGPQDDVPGRLNREYGS